MRHRLRISAPRLLSCALLLALPLAHASQDGAFFSSFEPGDPSLKTSKSTLAVDIAGGPDKTVVLTAKPGVGFTGLHSLHYQGQGGKAQEARLFDVKLPVGAHTQLSYLLFPVTVGDDLANPSTYTAIDLIFDDGSRLSTHAARDQRHVAATARAQGEARTLYPNQWNRLVVDLGTAAQGRTIERIVLVQDGPAGKVEGFLDDLRIGDAAADTATRPSDYVSTLRGTNSNADFSRGNNVVATALPHGFNFWAPVTDAGSDWMYQYQQNNGDDNRPRLQAFVLSHEPSPWMGDRQTFQLMPASLAKGAPTANRQARALSFSHANEVARADYYKVSFDNGIVGEITPTDHAAIFRFTFPEARSQLVFDNRTDEGGITLDPSGRSFSGYSDVKSRLSTGATRLFFYAEVDQPVSESGQLSGEGRDHVAAWFGFDTAKHKTVNMRIATSLISIEQAKHNLALEIAASDNFDSVRERARQRWDDQLGIVAVQGASHDELVTLYSNLYRLFLYPNSAYENVGDQAKPVYRYASPFSAATGDNTPTRTGARVLDGKVYVNNGFWDTYRTAWPAYTLLAPQQAGEMIDGFVQEYRDGGWIARWSSPGYADLMVGTSADVAFADAWLKGIRNFDVRSFYQAALKDATVLSPIAGTGRKGLERSNFNGYVDTGTKEGLSWSMDGYINDFAIGNLAAALAADKDAKDPYRANYASDAVYFHSRAQDYVNLFNPEIGFFVGRDAKGQWRYTKTQFDPLRWGDDYTETNAWNMAFHAPHDGAGLAALYGGRDQLAAKLDQFFATPGQFHVGGYGEPIHEMLEARDIRMGQYGHSNQPSHHILYMYAYAGQPWKTQDKVRDLLSRVYAGSDIGQGYPGDEDNGEMSAWYVFSAAGFYPLRMGSPEYVIGAPFFPHMDIKLDSGKHIVIDAPQVSDRNRYVQSLTVNGQPWHRLTLPHELLAKGATLSFEMGPEPSHWASDEAALPTSLSGTAGPKPLRDLTDAGKGERDATGVAKLDALFDNNGRTDSALAAHAMVRWHAPATAKVAMYTLTSAAIGNAPGDWTLEGSNDGKQWTALDRRHGERFPWPGQTRAFGIAKPAGYAWYRVRFGNAAAASLAEIELLGAQ